jgi:signal transduction histidine kinase
MPSRAAAADRGESRPALNAPGEHLGLIGMKERAEGLGAALIVDSTLGKGTLIELRLASPVCLDGD